MVELDSQSIDQLENTLEKTVLFVPSTIELCESLPGPHATSVYCPVCLARSYWPRTTRIDFCFGKQPPTLHHAIYQYPSHPQITPIADSQ